MALDIRALVVQSAESAVVRFRVVDGKGTSAQCSAKVSPVAIEETINDRKALSNRVADAEEVKLSVKLVGSEATATLTGRASGRDIAELIGPAAQAQTPAKAKA